MTALLISSSRITMDRGFAPSRQTLVSDPLYVRLARRLTEAEAAQWLLGAADHGETVNGPAPLWNVERPAVDHVPQLDKRLVGLQVRIDDPSPGSFGGFDDPR